MVAGFASHGLGVYDSAEVRVDGVGAVGQRFEGTKGGLAVRAGRRRLGVAVAALAGLPVPEDERHAARRHRDVRTRRLVHQRRVDTALQARTDDTARDRDVELGRDLRHRDRLARRARTGLGVAPEAGGQLVVAGEHREREVDRGDAVRVGLGHPRGGPDPELDRLAGAHGAVERRRQRDAGVVDAAGRDGAQRHRGGHLGRAVGQREVGSVVVLPRDRSGRVGGLDDVADVGGANARGHLHLACVGRALVGDVRLIGRQLQVHRAPARVRLGVAERVGHPHVRDRRLWRAGDLQRERDRSAGLGRAHGHDAGREGEDRVARVRVEQAEADGAVEAADRRRIAGGQHAVLRRRDDQARAAIAAQLAERADAPDACGSERGRGQGGLLPTGLRARGGDKRRHARGLVVRAAAEADAAQDLARDADVGHVLGQDGLAGRRAGAVTTGVPGPQRAIDGGRLRLEVKLPTEIQVDGTRTGGQGHGGRGRRRVDLVGHVDREHRQAEHARGDQGLAMEVRDVGRGGEVGELRLDQRGAHVHGGRCRSGAGGRTRRRSARCTRRARRRRTGTRCRPRRWPPHGRRPGPSRAAGSRRRSRACPRRRRRRGSRCSTPACSRDRSRPGRARSRSSSSRDRRRAASCRRSGRRGR